MMVRLCTTVVATVLIFMTNGLENAVLTFGHTLVAILRMLTCAHPTSFNTRKLYNLN